MMKNLTRIGGKMTMTEAEPILSEETMLDVAGHLGKASAILTLTKISLRDFPELVNLVEGMEALHNSYVEQLRKAILEQRIIDYGKEQKTKTE